MPSNDLRSPESALERLAALVQERPVLAEELSGSLPEFFGALSPAEDSEGYGNAKRRHLEWFLFERVSPTLDGVPAEMLMPEWMERCRGAELDLVEGLLTSLSGIFEITSQEPGQGVWARDLLGGGEYPLSEPEIAGELATGDLLVGRVFPIGEELYRLSPAVGVFRNDPLRVALHRDMEQLRGSRRGSLRMSQAELERMFFDVDAPPVDPVEARDAATTALEDGGIEPTRARELVDRVLADPFDPQSLVHGVSDEFGAVLDEIAFETDVDLEAARRAILAAWSAQSAADKATTEPPVHPSSARLNGVNGSAQKAQTLDPDEALAAFDRGRQTKDANLDELFDRLERDLGIAPAASQDGDESTPDFPGVVSAVLQEYRWDLERTGDTERIARSEILQGFAEYTAELGVFENLGRSQLVSFCALWVPERKAVETPEEAGELLDALADFCRWCEREHELELWTDFEQDWERLRADLPRVFATRPLWSEGGAGGALYQVDAGSLTPLSPSDAELPLDANLASTLSDGFVVRAEGATVQRVYPPLAREFLLDA